MNFGAGALGPAGLSSADLAANNNREPKIKKKQRQEQKKIDDWSSIGNEWSRESGDYRWSDDGVAVAAAAAIVAVAAAAAIVAVAAAVISL